MIYYLFDLTIDSEIPLPLAPLAPADSPQVDVVIRYGDVPPTIGEVVRHQSWYALSYTEGIFSIPNVASFHVKGGQKITIQAPASLELRILQVWLLGVGLSLLLHQRGVLQLHASAVVKDGEAILICGLKGAGKSTTAARFLQAGYQLMADDVSVVKEVAGEFRVFSAFPQQNLISDALEKLQLSAQGLEHLRPSDDKYVYPRGEQFHYGSALIRAICILEKGEVAFSLLPVYGVEKIALLQHNIIRKYFMVIPELIKAQQLLLLKLTGQIPMLHIQRPMTEDLLDEVYHQISHYVTDLKNKNQ